MQRQHAGDGVADPFSASNQTGGGTVMPEGLEGKPSPEFVNSQMLINKFYPLPRGEDEIYTPASQSSAVPFVSRSERVP